MLSHNYLVFCLLVVCSVISTKAVELTFELPDNARECFYEEIAKNVSATLEFQVRSYHFVVVVFLFSYFFFYFLFCWARCQ